MFALGYSMTNLMYTAFAAAVCSLLATAADAPEWKLRQPLDWELFAHLGKVTLDTTAELYAPQSKLILQTEEVLDGETAMRLVLSETVRVSLSVDQEVERILSSDSLGLEACRLRVAPLIGETSPLPTSLPYSLIVSRYSVVADVMGSWLVRMRESGLQKRLENMRLPTCNHLNNGFQSAGLAHVGSAVLIFVSGVVASIVLLALEIAAFAGWPFRLFRKRAQNDKKKNIETIDAKVEEVSWAVEA